METKRVNKTAKKDKSLLVSFARTIGSTLGTVAAKTDVSSKPAYRRPVNSKSGSKPIKTRKKNRV
jgi:hypothetical protein